MRNVTVLAIAQALSASGMVTMTLLGGILGSELAPSPGLATLPISMAILGLAGSTLPAALLMQRVGRRPAFIGSALLAAVAACVVAFAVVQQSFVLLCGAAFVLGSNLAFQQQHRFAAAEAAPDGRASQAVSWVMVGTLVAALLGPQIALALKELVPGHEYAGSFLGVAAFCLATALVLTRYSPPAPRSHEHSPEPARPWREVAAAPRFRIAVLASVIGYAVMSFIMTATPISMHVHDGHSDTQTAWVIQSHLLGMYAPSLFTGALVARIGTHSGMCAGLALLAACVAIDVSGRDLMHYWWGLVLLGVGWNLLFVAGTTLLTTAYRPAERFRAQGLNEFAVFGTQALASLLAGPAIHSLGWESMNLATLPLIGAMAIALWAWPEAARTPARAAGQG